MYSTPRLFKLLFRQSLIYFFTEIPLSRTSCGIGKNFVSKGGMHSWTLDEEKTREVIKHALDLGINFFDTALAYAGGTSEQYLGRALKDFAKREDVVIATKFLPTSHVFLQYSLLSRFAMQNNWRCRYILLFLPNFRKFRFESI